MIDAPEIREFRDYVAPGDEVARARAHTAVERAAARERPVPDRRRPRVRRLGLATIGLALVVSAAVALQPDRGKDPSTTEHRSSPGPLDNADAAAVGGRVAAAIEAADAVLHQSTRDLFTRSGHAIDSQSWTDLADAGAFRTVEDRSHWPNSASGFTVSDLGRVRRDDGSTLQRVVSDGRCTELVLLHDAGSGAVDPMGEIRDAVGSGRLVVVGTELVRGNAALHLREQNVDAEFPGLVDSTDFWVDPKTYLPLRSVSTSGDPAAPAGDPNELQRMTNEYEFVPRPADLASLLLPAIPAGVTCERTTRAAGPRKGGEKSK